MSSLTPKETEFLSRMAENGWSVFTIEQAKAIWFPPERTPDALYRLARKGWLRRLERGKYLLIPLEAGPARAWTENGLVIAQHLVEPAAIAYWTAMFVWTMTEQIPAVTIVQTTRRKQPTEIAGMRFRFVTVKEARFFGITTTTLAGQPVRITDREKTLIDCASRPDLSGGILQLARALKGCSSQIEWHKLDRYMEQWGGGTVAKRLGYLVEILELPGQKRRLDAWRSLISRGVSPLEPGAGNRGPIHSRWQLRLNVRIQGNEGLA